MNKLFKNIMPPLMAALLASGCNSGAGSAAEVAPDWQNQVTISHSSSLPYSPQGVNSYWLSVSNQTTNSLRLTKVSLIETSLAEIDIKQVVDSSSCQVLASGADCQLHITLPQDLAISGTPLIYFSLNYINDETGENFVVKKALTLYTTTESESSGAFDYSTNYLNQKIVDTAKSYSIAIPFRLTQDYQSLALNVAGAQVLSQKIICADSNNYKQGDSCSALIKLERKETHPQLSVKGITREGMTKNFAVNLNITPNVVASLVYLNAPLLLNPAQPTQKVTILNSGAASAKNINFTFANPEQVGVSVSSDCSGTTIAAGASCHLTYTLDNSKYISGAPKEQITYSNGTALAGETLDSYYVYTIPPVKTMIKITTSQGSYSLGDLLPAQSFSISATLSGATSTNQIVSVSNLASLQAAGMVIISTQATNPTSCILNATTLSCDFYVIASHIALLNNYTLRLVNSSNTRIDHPDILYNIVAAPSTTSTIRLPQTGKTISSKAFDDATYLMGVPWAKSVSGTTTPATRFTVGTGAEANCITDNLTGLMWPKNGIIGSKKNWKDALTTVANMNSAPTKLCGYTDWHLPTVNELSSMLNDGAFYSSEWLNQQGFRSVQLDYYWSSSTSASNTNNAWEVHFATSYVVNGNKTYAAYVWPVRLVQ